MATFTNQATLSYNGNTTTSNITTGEILEVLSVTKTAVVNTYSANDRITYVISIVNSGATALNGLTVTDDLGGYTLPDGTTQVYPLTYEQKSVQYFINGVRQTAAPAVVAGPPMTFSGISVPAGGITVLIYETRVNQNAPLTTDSSITNRAAVSGGGLTTPVADTEIVAASNEPLLTISKSLNPTTVTENGQDLHLRHPECRQYRGPGRRQRNCHRHIQPRAERDLRNLQRNNMDGRHPLHL